MTKKPASEEQLGTLHSRIADVMLNSLDVLDKAQAAYIEMEEEIIAEKGVKEPELNPALLSVMVRFLDANKITCAPAEGNAMSDLERKLEEKRLKRRTVGNVAYLDRDE